MEQGSPVAESHRIDDGLGHLNVVHGSLTEGWRYSDEAPKCRS